jgi:hypothetical protein
MNVAVILPIFALKGQGCCGWRRAVNFDLFAEPEGVSTRRGNRQVLPKQSQAMKS